MSISFVGHKGSKTRVKPLNLKGCGLLWEVVRCVNGGWGRNRTGVHGVAVRCMTTLPPSHFSLSLRLKSRDSDLTDRGFLYSWSGKRDSNSRPQPWQGCALPAELFPLRKSCIIGTSFFMSTLISHHWPGS